MSLQNDVFLTKEDILSSCKSLDSKYSKDNHLYCYTIARKDLEMPKGKLMSQLGHAYAKSLYSASITHPKVAHEFIFGNGGSIVSLYAKNENQIIELYNKVISLDIPAYIVVDSNHVLLPKFDGKPIITALGIGPCLKDDIQHLTKKFQCIQ